jgi:hypothetical protein
MRIQAKIQMSRDAPSDFTEEADIWMRREKLVNAQFEATRENAQKKTD